MPTFMATVVHPVPPLGLKNASTLPAARRVGSLARDAQLLEHAVEGVTQLVFRDLPGDDLGDARAHGLQQLTLGQIRPRAR